MSDDPHQKDIPQTPKPKKSGGKMSFIWTALSIGLLVLLICFAVLVFGNSTMSDRGLSRAEIGGVNILIGIADTPDERAQGLSGRHALPSGEGLLFIFDQVDIHSFWMKDMNFAIDILWLDQGKRVIHIEHSVQPNTYPKTFSAPTPSLYVLEVVAGLSKEKTIKIGDMLSF